MRTSRSISLLWVISLTALGIFTPVMTMSAEAISRTNILTHIRGQMSLRTNQWPTVTEAEAVSELRVRNNLTRNQDGNLRFSTMPVSTTTLRPPLVLRDHPPFCNGIFEKRALQCWSHGGEPPPSVTCTGNSMDNCYAALGDPGLGDGAAGGIPIGSSWIEQFAYVPNTSNPQLRLRYKIITYDSNAHALFDTFDVIADGE